MFRKLGWFGALWLVTGCATVKVQKERVEQVKSAAVVGFTGELDLKDPNEKDSSGGILGTVNAIKGTASLASGELQKARSAQAEKAYELLVAKLTQATGWKVLDRKELSANADYQQQLKEHPNEGLALANTQMLPEVLREEVAKTLDEKQRAQLMQKLGVDAIALVRVKYVVGSTSGFTIGGVGKVSKHPKAVVQFTVYDLKSGEPLWKDPWAEGKATEEGLANVMGVQLDEKETEVLLAAADSGFGRLIHRYEEAKGKTP